MIIPRKLTSIRSERVDSTRRITQLKCTPATHVFVFVFMIGNEAQNQKPYELPIQCVPYAGVNETNIQRLVTALVKYKSEMHKNNETQSSICGVKASFHKMKPLSAQKA